MYADEKILYNGQLMRRDYVEFIEEAQQLTHYRLEDRLYPRLPYGSETFRFPAEAAHQPCRHCDVVQGQLHEPLCDYEQCPICSGQVMSCDCDLFTEDAVRPDSV